ncbi:hypothetical protein ccbrp13_14330 [Ktedonobacteria bacterium brp13]|nr:hypothetical protein ccbrp13_14330 [Ktedonobacteria bacterium brp13]
MMEPKRTGRDGFAHVLRAEWTTFRKGHVFLIGMVVAALATALLGLCYVAVNGMPCAGASTVCSPALVGPDGEAVDDKFYFVYQPLAGNGSITVRLTSMTGEFAYVPPNANPNVPSLVLVPGVQPWAKAGVIIKASTTQGSPYTAMMLTGSHGVRMQDNFTQDIAGLPGGVSSTSPRWLRLTRSDYTLTGYDSTDGTQWTRVGTVQLAGLPATVQVGLFVTSPCVLTVSEGVGGCRYTQATAVFDHVSLQGEAPRGAWSRDDVGVTIDPNGKPHHPGSLVESGGTFTVAGNGDIAPRGAKGGRTIELTLRGAVAGLIVVIVVAVLFVTAESPSGRIPKRASPQRRRVLTAKALVLGVVTFTTQLLAAVIAVQLGTHLMLSNGGFLPVSFLTEWRVMVGTAAAIAVAAIFALALGALFRRRVVAVAASIALTVFPFIFAFVNLAPVSQWLLRITPAAGFAIQQSIPAYPQVADLYTPQAGYYPLAPWAGFAVLCGYTVFALGLAIFMPRRRET